MKFGICTLDDFELKGKTVLCRVDINQPVDRKTGTLKDTTRIKACIPTIKELSDKKAKVVLLAHQGGDLEYKNYYTTAPHARVLSELLGKEVRFIDDVNGPAARDMIRKLKEGEILLLDNVRFMSEEMTLFETKLKLSDEEQSKTQVVSKLAPLADLYVCDAFAAAHRAQPTLVGFQQLIPSAMGRLFEEEMSVLYKVMDNPKKPCVFILGGAKIEDAFMMMDTVLKSGAADTIVTGGLVSQLIMIAQGRNIGIQSYEYIRKCKLLDLASTAGDLISKYEDKIMLPDDFAFVSEKRIEADADEIPDDVPIMDIGHKTADKYAKIIEKASTIFINGPMGVFENELSEYGTKTVWEAAAKSKAFSLLGGGDSITAANKYKLEKDISYICTAGGALVRFLSGEELPAVKALRQAALKYS